MLLTKVSRRTGNSLILEGCILKRTLVFDISQHWKDIGPQVHLLDEKPPDMVELTKSNGVELYKDMHLIRVAEKACAGLYRKKLVRGFCHLYTGQEAIATGISSVLTPDDTVITSYRCHGWLLARTRDLLGFLAEILGNSDGLSRGKGGSMHLYHKNFFGGNGIVGAHVPLGVGIALKHKYSNSKAVSVIALGDGSYVQGQVSEAFNIAKLLNLPALFVVENNRYGMGTSSDRSAANNQYYKSCSYLPGIRVNGMNVLSVISAANFAVDRIREGKGPILLEMMTYRYRGHSMSDPGTAYRDREEIKKVLDERDCLKFLAKLLTESKLSSDEEIKKINSENVRKVSVTVEAAKKGKPVPLEELTADCYSNYSGKIRMPRLFTELPYHTIAKYVGRN